jgi:sulfur-oxidizing protein SoxA
MLAGLGLLLLAVSLPVRGADAAEPQLPIPATQLRSGIAFAGGDVRALQADAAANPAQLWIDQGRQMWSSRPPPGGASPARACLDCHGPPEALRGAAASFPRLHGPTGRLFNLEDQIRHCRAEHQGQAPWAFESDELLGTALLVTQVSEGLPLNSDITPELRPHFEAGQALYRQRQGQLNLACTHCHDWNWGRRFHTDLLSQGHPNGYPVLRLEWQKPGSLERRLRSCYFGVRAATPPWGDLSMRQLALYLRWRGQGLPIEVPAVRK